MKVRNLEITRHALPKLDASPVISEPLAAAQEIAILPEDAAAETLAGRIADGAADRVVLGLVGMNVIGTCPSAVGSAAFSMVTD